MNEDTFWELIDAARVESGGDITTLVASLESKLIGMPIDDIIGFENIMCRFLDQAYDARLWAAGCILDELSDDGFLDFRAWLISRGKDVYIRCLDNPEALVDVVSPGDRVTAEELNSVCNRAYRAKTGRDYTEVISRPSYEPELKNESLSWTTSEGYVDSKRLCELFPKLCARFGVPG